MAMRAQMVTLVPIRNMSRGIRFYTKVLGAKVNSRGTGPMKNFWASLQLGGTEFWLVAPSKREKRTLAYTTLVVKNIRSAVKRLARARVKFTRPERMGPETRVEGPIAFESFGAAAFFKDTEGNLWMLWQSASGM
ncbi:MAG TPA: VOC family protein [Thermoplasmata archaeon]|nr:VOC family protein [Thermoplasmata archaeon]